MIALFDLNNNLLGNSFSSIVELSLLHHYKFLQVMEILLSILYSEDNNIRLDRLLSLKSQYHHNKIQLDNLSMKSVPSRVDNIQHRIS